MPFARVVQVIGHLLEPEGAREPPGDGQVVGGRVGEGLGGEPAALLQGEPLPRGRGCDLGIARGRGDDGDRRVVLRGRAHHRGPADVDLLDALVETGAGGGCPLEGVEVAHHQVEGGDAQVGQLGSVAGFALVGQDPGVD